ncbi:NAD-dependent protein deacetylase hst4 [Ceratocystis fimbriata CBS 114723]|uniref:NAD-dependent protein deacetylase hst4 n=1 Tax=Ceratocystis fimbriata CBS 114723 TaxID=1035309 RepID=A0A2C5WWX9_9PEZI|nr:NAD-dependent protein deacetylase hst4 [Ceratocystis fimbriata CBS 114723]
MEIDFPRIPTSPIPIVSSTSTSTSLLESTIPTNPPVASNFSSTNSQYCSSHFRSSSPLSGIGESPSPPPPSTSGFLQRCPPSPTLKDTIDNKSNTQVKRATTIKLKIASAPSKTPSQDTRTQAQTQTTISKSLPQSLIHTKSENTWKILLKAPPSSPTSLKSTKRPRTALPDSRPQTSTAKRRKLTITPESDDMRRNAPRSAKDASATAAKNVPTRSKSTKASTTIKASEPKRPVATTGTDKIAATKTPESISSTKPATAKTTTTKGPKLRTTEYLDLDEVCKTAAEDGVPNPGAEHLETLMNALRKKKKIVVIAGAGISVSAGIPDFRSGHGLFKTLKSEHKLKVSGKQLFDASVYKDNNMTESFHAMVRKLSDMVKEAKPTPFHHMLASLAEEGRLLRLYTQNIDCIDTGLEPLASNVPLNQKGPWPRTIQLHGSVRHMTCSKCGFLGELQSELFDGPIPPECAQCLEEELVRMNFARKRSQGVGKLRPRIVLYNEGNPDEEAIGAVSLADLRARPDAVIVVGTTMKIPGLKRLVRELCAVTRDRRDGFTAWINLEPEPQTAEFRDCWDLVVKAKCDDVATLLSLPRWDEYRAWAANGSSTIIPTAADQEALRCSRLEVALNGTAQKKGKGKAKASNEDKAQIKTECTLDSKLGCVAPASNAKKTAGAPKEAIAIEAAEVKSSGQSGFSSTALTPVAAIAVESDCAAQESRLLQQKAVKKEELEGHDHSRDGAADASEEGLIVHRLRGVKLSSGGDDGIEAVLTAKASATIAVTVIPIPIPTTAAVTNTGACLHGDGVPGGQSFADDTTNSDYNNQLINGKISIYSNSNSSISASHTPRPSKTTSSASDNKTVTCYAAATASASAVAAGTRSMTSAGSFQPQPRAKPKATRKKKSSFVASSQRNVISEEPAAESSQLDSAVSSPSEFALTSAPSSTSISTSTSTSTFNANSNSPSTPTPTSTSTSTSIPSASTSAAPATIIRKQSTRSTHKQSKLEFSSTKASLVVPAVSSSKKKSDPDVDSILPCDSTSSSAPSRRRSIKHRAAKTKAAAVAASSSRSTSSKPKPGVVTRSKDSTITTFVTTVTKSSALSRKAFSEFKLPRPVTITPPSPQTQLQTQSSPPLSAIALSKTPEPTYTPESPTSLCDLVSSPVSNFGSGLSPDKSSAACDTYESESESEAPSDLDCHTPEASITMGSKDESGKKRAKKYGPTFKVQPMPPPEIPVIPDPPFKMSENGSNKPYKCLTPSTAAAAAAASASAGSSATTGSDFSKQVSTPGDTISPSKVPRGMESLLN